ncbi:hypothetical protein MBLNU457_2136t1 [Dothideomycetes sp. NU457]
MAASNAGGFIPYSPPPSSLASSNASQALPHPRSTPLKPGGTKESSFIRHVDHQILHIQRRFAKRTAPTDGYVQETDEDGRTIEEIDDPTTKSQLEKSEEWHDVRGYNTFAEATRDIEELIGVIWISGTPSLQVPYLISLALLTNTMITAFPAAPRHMFRLLGKLDHAFASLLQQRDIETGEPLPGFSMGKRVSTTEKVRIKSLIERARISATTAMSKGDFEEDEEPAASEEALDGELILESADEGDDEDWNMQIARVYDKTLVEIGDSMDGPAIGIRTG